MQLLSPHAAILFGIGWMFKKKKKDGDKKQKEDNESQPLLRCLHRNHERCIFPNDSGCVLLGREQEGQAGGWQGA